MVADCRTEFVGSDARGVDSAVRDAQATLQHRPDLCCEAGCRSRRSSGLPRQRRRGKWRGGKWRRLRRRHHRHSRQPWPAARGHCTLPRRLPPPRTVATALRHDLQNGGRALRRRDYGAAHQRLPDGHALQPYARQRLRGPRRPPRRSGRLRRNRVLGDPTDSEFGLRVALGAQPISILSLAVARTARLTLADAGFGRFLAWILGALLKRALDLMTRATTSACSSGVGIHDAVSLAGATAMLASIALRGVLSRGASFESGSSHRLAPRITCPSAGNCPYFGSRSSSRRRKGVPFHWFACGGRTAPPGSRFHRTS